VADGNIEYIRTGDGLHIAYQTRGSGPIDMLEIGSFGSLFPLDAVDDQPRWHRFEERLHRFARVTKFDLRGIGYSDQFTSPPTLDDYVSDAIAVLDAAHIERAVVLASGYAGHAAVELAAQFPDRVDSLILANTNARARQDEDYQPIDDRSDEVDEWRAAIEPGSPESRERSDIDILAPSLAGDADVRRWWERSARRGAGPAVAAAIWDLALSADVRDILPTLTVPTLVIVTTHNRFSNPEFGYWMADRIPGAKTCAIDAPDHLVWAVPDDAVVNEIERHLTGSLATSSLRRSMAAVLFTDIVESTAHNSTRGDRAWLELLARHDELAEHEIKLRGGRTVKRLGDGLLAVFPLASDALDAATAVVDRVADLGIGVRAAMHVAEVEEVGDDVLGLGVTIAARALGEAAGGEVLSTRSAADALAGSSHGFESRGTYEFKGVPGEWELMVSTAV
jgi:pimeloyl-ACP methyl ester carboxylesterase